MKTARALVGLAVACSAPSQTPWPQGDDTASTSTAPVAPTPPATPDSPDRLEIRFLGVGGYLIQHGDDVVMTPPMYTNPDFFETTLGSIHTDPDLVDRLSGDIDFGGVSAILVGHAHYDHLLDAPTLWPRTNDAVFYGSATTAHLLAAHAPDRDPSCDAVLPQAITIPRDRVVVMDDAVDRRMCGGPNGSWVTVPGANVRVRALCSMHPDQFGPVHFAPGSLDADVCEPPPDADAWVEGETLAYLIDFLGDDGTVIHRVYYQDAPTNVPIGLFHPELLLEQGVDVALLNVGSYEGVTDHPAATLQLLSPRYTVGGHWEDFFRTQDRPLLPIIGHDVEGWVASAKGAMPLDPVAEALVGGVLSGERVWAPDPRTPFVFLPASVGIP